MSPAKKRPIARRTARRTQIDWLKLSPGSKVPGGIFAGISYARKKPEALIVGPWLDGELNWDTAVERASKVSVDEHRDYALGYRLDLALCQATVPELFEGRTCWSCEQYVINGAYAWGHNFYNGTQDRWIKSYKSRIHVFRRVPI